MSFFVKKEGGLLFLSVIHIPFLNPFFMIYDYFSLFLFHIKKTKERKCGMNEGRKLGRR